MATLRHVCNEMPCLQKQVLDIGFCSLLLVRARWLWQRNDWEWLRSNLAICPHGGFPRGWCVGPRGLRSPLCYLRQYRYGLQCNHAQPGYSRVAEWRSAECLAERPGLPEPGFGRRGGHLGHRGE